MWLIKSRFSSKQETVKERALKVGANVAGQVVIYHNYGYFNIVTIQISSPPADISRFPKPSFALLAKKRFFC